MPEHNVYAWQWKYFPELEQYRAFVWMNHPFDGEDKVRFDRYIPVDLAPNASTVLSFLKSLVALELLKGSKINGLKKV